MVIYRLIRAQLERSVAILSGVVGLVTIVLGWYGISGVTLPAEQLPYLASNGILGVFFLGVAATMWLSADLRDQWRKLDEIHQSITRQVLDQPTTPEPDVAHGSVGAVSDASGATSNGHARATVTSVGRVP
jgi:hypothetical protein